MPNNKAQKKETEKKKQKPFKLCVRVRVCVFPAVWRQEWCQSGSCVLRLVVAVGLKVRAHTHTKKKHTKQKGRELKE